MTEGAVFTDRIRLFNVYRDAVHVYIIAAQAARDAREWDPGLREAAHQSQLACEKARLAFKRTYEPSAA
jgi:hypothetical protein